jgi:hypothetical protein
MAFVTEEYQTQMFLTAETRPCKRCDVCQNLKQLGKPKVFRGPLLGHSNKIRTLCSDETIRELPLLEKVPPSARKCPQCMFLNAMKQTCPEKMLNVRKQTCLEKVVQKKYFERKETHVSRHTSTQEIQKAKCNLMIFLQKHRNRLSQSQRNKAATMDEVRQKKKKTPK